MNDAVARLNVEFYDSRHIGTGIPGAFLKEISIPANGTAVDAV
jgi:hypothetical protein